jgi:hypothetical protein
MNSLPPLPPRYRRVAERVEEAAAQADADGKPSSIALEIVIEEGASRAEIKAAQKAAIDAHLAEHPEDRGREVDWWLVRTIIHPKGPRPAEYEPPRAAEDAPPPPAPTAPKPPLVDWDAPALDWRNNPP